MDAPIGGVEDRVRRRDPLRIGAERGAAFVNAPRLQFAFGGFLFTHFDEFKIALLRDDRELREGLAPAERHARGLPGVI